MKKSLSLVLSVLVFLLCGCESQDEPLSVSKKQLYQQLEPLFSNPCEELLRTNLDELYVIETPEQLAKINPTGRLIELDFRKNCIVYTSCIREGTGDYIEFGAYDNRADSIELVLEYYPREIVYSPCNQRIFVWAVYSKEVVSKVVSMRANKRDRRYNWGIFGIENPKTLPWIADLYDSNVRMILSECVLRDTTNYEVIFAYQEISWSEQAYDHNFFYDKDGNLLDEYIHIPDSANLRPYKVLGRRVIGNVTCEIND